VPSGSRTSSAPVRVDAKTNRIPNVRITTTAAPPLL
jgi:hypothetical protein